MINNMKNLIRLLKISFVLAHHDALFLLEKIQIAPFITGIAKLFSYRKTKGRPGQRLAKAFEELGPAFIKLGQALSIRPDLVGDEVAEDLSNLQDHLPPFSSDKARAVIEQELEKTIDELFKQFEDQPVAAASIAQVHFAVDTEGNEVAVKVLRPGVEEAFAKDVRLFYWIAGITEKSKPKLHRLKFKEIVDKFAETVKMEMDLRFEAAAASEMQKNFAHDPELVIPKIDWQRTSRRVLTTERIEGINIDDTAALTKAGHDLDAIIAKSASSMFKQIFRDGFFHADLHPGNFFVGKDGNLIAVDFGITGRLDRETRLFLAQMLQGFLEKDYKKVAEVHFSAGYVPANQSQELFAQACRSIGEPIFGLPQSEISIAKLLSLLFKISEDFQMETQPQLLLLQKTMMIAEGVGRTLNPNVNMWQQAEPLVREWALENFGLEAKIREAAENIKNIGGQVYSLFEAMENLNQVVTKDGIKLHPETIDAIVEKSKKA